MGLLGMGIAATACLQSSGPAGGTDSRIGRTRSALSVPVDTILPTQAGQLGSTFTAAGHFAVSADGQATYSLPIWAPQGRQGVQPALSLGYTSRGGNGLLGVGWSLGGLHQISRCKLTVAQDGVNRDVQFDAFDRYCLDGQRLVQAVTTHGNYTDSGQEYRTEVDEFVKVVAGPITGSAIDPPFFQAFLKSGQILTFGAAPDTDPNALLRAPRIQMVHQKAESSVVASPAGQVSFSWAVSKVEDRFGNEMKISYSLTTDAAGGVEQRPTEIDYTFWKDPVSGKTVLGSNRAVEFGYETRPDPIVTWVSGVKLTTAHRLSSINAMGPNPTAFQLLKSYVIHYGTSPATGRTLLQSVVECDGAGVCAFPISFAYEQGSSAFQDVDVGITAPDSNSAITDLVAADVNGDGCDDLIYHVGSADGGTAVDLWDYRLSSCYDAIKGNPAGALALPPGRSGFPDLPLAALGSPRFLDLDLDGRTDVTDFRPFPTVSSGLFATTWRLASLLTPAQWQPGFPLYDESIGAEYDDRRQEQVIIDLLFGSAGTRYGYVAQKARQLLFTYTPSSYVGDINGDGFPDLVEFLGFPNAGSGVIQHAWSFRLNHGRSGGLLQVDAQPTLLPTTATGLQNVSMVDVDRSGTTSALLFGTDGWHFAYKSDLAGANISTTDISLFRGEASSPQRRDLFLDLNGDGLPDAVSYAVTGIQEPLVATNTGNGFSVPAFANLSLADTFSPPVKLPDPAIRIADFDGDGKQDIWLLSASGSLDSRTSPVVLTHGDEGFVEVIPQVLGTGPLPFADNGPDGATLAQLIDVNGDGLSDLVQVVGGDVHLYIRQGNPPDLLTRVDDRTFDSLPQYAPITSQSTYQTTAPPGVANGTYPTCVLNRGLWVVNQYEQGLPTASTFVSVFTTPLDTDTYGLTYQDGRSDLLGRGWLGFAKRVFTNQQTGMVVTTTYDNQSMVGSAYQTPFRPLTESTDVVVDSTHERLHTVANTYVASSNTANLGFTVFLTDTQVTDSEGPPGLPLTPFRTLGTHLVFDSFGNVTSRTSTTGDGFTEASSFQFLPADTTHWLVAQEQLSKQTSSTPTESKTRTTQFQPDSVTGVVDFETLEPGGDETLFRKTTYTRDPQGVLSSIDSTDMTGTLHRTVSFTHDPTDDIYPTSVQDGLGHTVQLAVHPGLGVLALQEDQNQVLSKWQYDGFGRPMQYTSPEQAVTTLGYQSIVIDNSNGSQGPSEFVAFPKTTVSYPNGQNVEVDYDFWGREYGRHWLGFDGRAVTSSKQFDMQGNVLNTQGPCDASTCPAQTFAHDNLGRLTLATQADNSSVQYAYDFLKTTRTDEVGNVSFVVTDQLGRATTSVKLGLAQPVTVTHGTGPFGLLERITDDQQNVTGFTYDVRGRRLTSASPDSSTHTYLWNPFDELDTDTELSGVVGATKFQRDALGRVAFIFSRDGTTTFNWDACPNGLGKLCSTTSPDNVTVTNSYDSLSRLSQRGWTIQGTQLSYQMGFDALGRPSTLTYPTAPNGASFGTTRTYNPFGYLSEVSDTASTNPYWLAEAENADGEVTSELLGDGSRTTRAFDNLWRQRLISTSAAGTSIQEQKLDYWPDGNLKTRTDLLEDVAEGFVYDPLDRLSQWTVNKTGADVLVETFGYDTIGNLRLRTPTVGSSDSQVLQYGQGAGPHALTTLNSETLAYDPAGRQVTSSNGRLIQYTAFDLPLSVSTAAGIWGFTYDAAHSRASKQSPLGDTTLYAGELYEKRTGSAGTTHVFYVEARDRVVAEVDWPELGTPAVKYLHDGHQGSVESSTSASGTSLPGAKFEPFGQPRDPTNPAVAPPSPSLSSLLGFTGEEHDLDLGLINLRGRAYEPRTQHFLTPDPLIPNALSNESLNPYGYVENNPLNRVDPSGFDDDPGGIPPQTQNITICLGEPGSGCSVIPASGAPSTTLVTPAPYSVIPIGVVGDDTGAGTPWAPFPSPESDFEPYPLPSTADPTPPNRIVLALPPAESADVAPTPPPPGWPAQVREPPMQGQMCVGDVCNNGPRSRNLSKYYGPFERFEAQRVAQFQRDVSHSLFAVQVAATLPTLGTSVAGPLGLETLEVPAVGATAEGVSGATEEAFHYTFGRAVPSIEAQGLRAGSYATTTGRLSPLQAHIDLALPANRGLPDALLRIDLGGLRQAGYELPQVTRVGRAFGMPGGGLEMRFPYPIPPEFITIVRP